jgi:hypothetical protein
MGKEIEILDKAPIILTKDKDWDSAIKMEPGAIIILPDDAVLVIPPKEELDNES